MPDTLRSYFDTSTRARGETYVTQGRVQSLESVDGRIEARVRGTRTYIVVLEFPPNGSHLQVSCSCPQYLGGMVCKHLWAVILVARQQRLLPDGRLDLIESDEAIELDDERDDERDEDDFSSDHRRRTPAPPAPPRWKKVIDALGSAAVFSRPAPLRVVPEEILYVMRATPHALAIEIMGRSRKKGGEWGRWKLIALRPDELVQLSEFDRATIALLQRSSIYDIDARISLSPLVTAWWIERIAREKKLALLRGENDPQPITWDDGPPWRLRIAIENDAAGGRWVLRAKIERDGTSMAMDKVDALLPDVIIRDGVASRFDDGGRSDWLRVLRANPDVEIPHAQTEAFREALMRVPMANIDVPEELGWSVVQVRPQPILSLRYDAFGSELGGELYFLYDDWRASSRSTESQRATGKKVIARDRAAEDALRARLVALGAVSTHEGWRIRAGQFEPVVRKLAEEGWLVEIDSAPVRVADDFDIELSSGIDWFDLNVSATFGEVRVEMPELLSAAEGQRNLMRLSDGAWGIVPLAWTDSLAPVLDLGKRTGDVLRFRKAQALLIDALLAERKPKADASFRALRSRILDARPEPRTEPPTLGTELRPYQRAGLGWMSFLRETGIGGCLADDMGLGKTVQTLAMLEELRASGNRAPSLVVAPRSLLFNWAAEAKRFAPELRVLEHHGSERGAAAFDDYDIILTTYATMRLDVAELAKHEFEYVILDEAQAIKNASSQVAKASRLLRARHRLALSGTPIENHLGELWSLFEFLNPGLLGSPRLFSRTFAAKNVPPERREALARALRPLILRRTKEQVAPELPERTEQTLFCELEGEQRKQYDDLRDHYRNILLGRVREDGIGKARMQILEALLRLRQAACHPALVTKNAGAPSAKVELLFDELSDVLESGHRALVFSQFTSFLDLVRGELDARKIQHLYLDGQTRDRQSLVERFQSGDGPPLFLISLKAGGLGLNLTAADYIFLLDPWWNPAVEAQAIDRAHRIGRTKPVVAYRLIARDTVEEKILELQSRKRELAESILSEDNSMLRKLELEDLEMLLG